jgi:nucleotide-binding universal stress UspA family protein
VPGDDVGDTLATLAGDVGAPLLIVGTEAGPGLADRLRPSVASTAVRSSPCPVLVVPLRD